MAQELTDAELLEVAHTAEAEIAAALKRMLSLTFSEQMRVFDHFARLERSIGDIISDVENKTGIPAGGSGEKQRQLPSTCLPLKFVSPFVHVVDEPAAAISSVEHVPAQFGVEGEVSQVPVAPNIADPDDFEVKTNSNATFVRSERPAVLSSLGGNSLIDLPLLVVGSNSTTERDTTPTSRAAQADVKIIRSHNCAAELDRSGSKTTTTAAGSSCSPFRRRQTHDLPLTGDATDHKRVLFPIIPSGGPPPTSSALLQSDQSRRKKYRTIVVNATNPHPTGEPRSASSWEGDAVSLPPGLSGINDGMCSAPDLLRVVNAMKAERGANLL